MSEPIVERHRPESLDEVQGHNKHIRQLREWADRFDDGSGGEAQLLVGPPGIGKTTVAYCLAEEYGWPLHEVNASASRTSDDIAEFVQTMRSTPSTADYQLVLLDEVDSQSGRTNIDPLLEELSDPTNPVIFTANDEYSVPDSIKRRVNVREFSLGKRSRKAYIKTIADREGVDLQPSELGRLVERPDLRSALNDLQHASGDGAVVDDGGRSWDVGEFDAVDALLTGDRETYRDSLGVDDNTFDDPGDAALWLDENVTNEFRGLEQGLAYQMLARADEWAGRAWENREFALRRYASAFLWLLPEARMTDPYDGWMNLDFPMWFRRSEPSVEADTGVAQLYRVMKGDRGFEFAGSFREFRHDILPIVRGLDAERRREMVVTYGLEKPAIEALELDPDAVEEWADIDIDQDDEPRLSESASAASW